MLNRLENAGKIIVAAVFVACTIVAGCKSTSTTPKKQQPDGKSSATTTAAPTKKTKVEDFDKFYDRFHADSAFQMSRIKFPLKGASHDIDNSTAWTPKNWQIMRTRVYDVDQSKYKVKYTKTETTFTQRVWIDGAGFNTECRFELIDGKWFLVYVKDENL